MSFRIKKILLIFFVSRKITNVLSLKIKSKFEQWVKNFDIKEADLRHSEFDINLLFRGFSKDDPNKLFAYIMLQSGIFRSLFKKKK